MNSKEYVFQPEAGEQVLTRSIPSKLREWKRQCFRIGLILGAVSGVLAMAAVLLFVKWRGNGGFSRFALTCGLIVFAFFILFSVMLALFPYLMSARKRQIVVTDRRIFVREASGESREIPLYSVSGLERDRMALLLTTPSGELRLDLKLIENSFEIEEAIRDRVLYYRLTAEHGEPAPCPEK